MSILRNTTISFKSLNNKVVINPENRVHLPLKCAILKLELEIGKRFCKASRQRPSQVLGFRVSGLVLAGPTIFRPTPSFGWAFVFLGKFGWSGPARLHCVANVNDFGSRDTSSPVRDFIRFDLRKASVPRPEGRSSAVTQLGGLQMSRSTRQG
jgi:hypothetical protein